MDFSSFSNVTSAVQQAGQTAVGNLATSLQQGASSLQAGIQGLAGDLQKVGLSAAGSLSAGIDSIMGKMKSPFQNLKDAPLPQANPPQEDMARKEGSIHQFPADKPLYSMKFTFFKYRREAATSLEKMEETVTVFLPLPTSIQEAFSMRVSELEIGGIASAVQTVGESLMKGGGGAMDGADRVLKQAAADNGSSVDQVKAALAGVLAGEKAAAITGQSLGVAPNPHVGLIFQGVNIRAPHEFSYRFAPRSQDESIALREIIRELKYRMHPGSSLLAFSYPDLCKIKIIRPDNKQGSMQELFEYKPCFLESMTVNYAPGGVPTFFAGTREPTEIEIKLTFKEITIFTRDDFKVKGGQA